MNRLLAIVAAGLVGSAGLVTADSASASADDQASADATIAAFNERMLDAGGESNGPPDTEPVDPEEFAAENPGSECFGEFLYGLDPSGRLEGETARAFSDYFSFAPPEGSELTGGDQVSAGVVTVDADHQGAVHDFVDLVGSEDLASCVEEAYTAMLAAEMESAGTAVSEGDASTVDATSEGDLGVGDASAHIAITVSYVIAEVPYVFNVEAWVAVVDRTLVSFTLTGGEERVTELDPVEELESLVDSL